MHCRNCGEMIDEKAVVCVHCGVPPKKESKYCNNCGIETNENQSICTKCGVALSGASGEKSKIVAGVFAILLGGFGAHKFYLGYTVEGVITIAVFWLGMILLAIPTAIMGVVVLIEGVIYLLKSDYEFQQTYVVNKKGWF
jgi:TM2 domain-containing membrane protein YozV